MTEVFEQPAADLGRDPPRPAVTGRARFGADRHSRGVALLKRLLPAVGAALLLMVGLWPRLAPLFERGYFRAPAIDVRAARELTMVNPRYAGTDRLNRPYVITAAVGRQVPNSSNLMALDRPRAVMVVHSGATVVLTAASAVYQAQSKLLDMFREVTLTHQNGTRFTTDRAHADFSDNTAEGHDPIQGHGPAGDIWGQGFRVLDRGDTIVFTGRSHLILKQTQASKPASPPEPPRRILTTAAAVEAAARAPANPHLAAAGRAKPTDSRPLREHHSPVRPHHPAKRLARAPAKTHHAARRVEPSGA